MVYMQNYMYSIGAENYVLFPQSLYSVYNFTSRHKPKEGGSNYVVCISVPYGQDKPLRYHSTNVKVCLN